MATTVQDRQFMQYALELAAQAEGQCRPNPMVGAVVVRRGKIVGEGYHRLAGQAHAEVVALRRAGKRARGATLYVTLEPCSHFGRTPPCVEAVIASGVQRVVYAMRDPNPQVAGRGLRALRKAGVTVEGPLCRTKAEHLNRAYLHCMQTKTPYVVLKVGSTLDGKLCDRAGRSQWITNEAARRYAHQWRARVDAILIGVQTLHCDNPSLTVRLPRYRGAQPTPIVWVGDARVPWKSSIVNDESRSSIFIVSKISPSLQRRIESLGHRVLLATSVSVALKKLGALGISSLMLEGGPQTIGAFLRAGAVHYAVACVAPVVLGGMARGWTDDASWPLTSPAQIQVERAQIMQDNVVVEGPFVAS